MKMISLIILFISFNTLACTIFMQPETGMVAKNYDWSLAEGEMIVRPINAKKKALESNKNWISLYGSVTFNQYGPDLPAGGMNTEGLMIEALILGGTKYRSLYATELIDSINESEFIQYNLDLYKTVDEVVANADKFNLKKTYVPIHYFTCDSSKKCAVIEYINGETIIHTDASLELPILTNMSYAKTLRNYNQDAPQTSEAFSSYFRFKKLADFPLADFSKHSMLKKLNSVKVTGTTVWQLLYSPQNKTIDLLHIFSSIPVSVNFKKLDFECKATLNILSLKDKDQSFSHKDISLVLARRAKNLKELSAATLQALSERKLANDCL
jgi:penicillin V acylase-like amidase (Ntn superfamily)